MNLPVEKYTHYVERLLLDNPTQEPTESITVLPSMILSPSFSPSFGPSFSPTLCPKSQYIMIDSVTASVSISVTTSIVTSIVTTYLVLIFSYCCIVLRAKLKRQYLNNIYPSSHSSSSSQSSESSSTFTAIELVNVPTQTQELFWFDNIYSDSENLTEQCSERMSPEEDNVNLV